MVLLLVPLAIYCALIVLLTIGWLRLPATTDKIKTTVEERISVVVPVRNEQENIVQLLISLQKQDYKNYEIIIVDDHSTDHTLQKMKGITIPHLKIVTNSGFGKKAAITSGVIVAEGKIIATTDADCTVPPTWMSNINDCFQDENTLFAFGPVAFNNEKSFFSDLQAIEFSSLVGSAAASISYELPIMCNGANLAYRRQAFMEVGGYEFNEHIASGDDEFLMRKILEKYPTGIRFIADRKAVVITQPQTSLALFFTQRLRWAAKWRYNPSFHTQLLALLVFTSNVAVILTIATLPFNFSRPLAILLLVKAFVEGFFLYLVSSFLNQRWNWAAFVVLQITHPFYVVITATASLFMRISWKGRNI